MNVTADLHVSEGKRAIQKRRLQDLGGSEPLSNLPCRLEIQGGAGARMTLQPCLQRMLTPAVVGTCEVSEGVPTMQGSILGSLCKQRELGVVTAPGRGDATTPRLHACPPLWDHCGPRPAA